MSGIVTLSKEHIDDKTLKGMLKRAGVIKYKQNADGTIDILEAEKRVSLYPHSILGTVYLTAKDPWVSNGKLAVKFGNVAENFYCRDLGLTSFEGFPTVIEGSCDCSHNQITSWEHLTGYIHGVLNANYLNITSMEGIGNILKSVRQFYFSEKKIKRSIIELVQIRDLTKISDATAPFKIVSKYLGQPDEIFECQTELIENGFEEYAQ